MPEGQERAVDRRLTVLCASASSVAFFDTGAFLLAVPSASADLGAAFPTAQAWVGVPLALLGGLVLATGWLADRAGPLRMLRLGLTLSVLASFLAALSPTAAALTVARAAQGLGFALFVPASLTLLRHQVDAARAVRIWTSLVSITTLSAPGIAAVVLTIAGWRTVLGLEAGVAAAALLASWWIRIDAPPGDRSVRASGLAFLLLILGSVGIVFGATASGGAVDWVLVGAGGIATLAALVVLRRATDTVLIRSAVTLNGFTVLAYAALAVVPFLLSIYLQGRGWSALLVGLVLTVDGVVLALLTPILGRRHARTSALLATGAGLGAAVLAALSGLAVMGRAASLPLLVAALAILGVAAACFVAPLTHGVLAGVPSGRAGQAAGLNLALARLAAGASIALVGPLLTVGAVASMERDAPGCCVDELADHARVAPLEPEQRPEELPAATAVRGSDVALASGLGAAAAAYLGAGAIVVVRRRSLEPTSEQDRDAR